jgi:hypothetical protein
MREVGTTGNTSPNFRKTFVLYGLRKVWEGRRVEVGGSGGE